MSANFIFKCIYFVETDKNLIQEIVDKAHDVFFNDNYINISFDLELYNQPSVLDEKNSDDENRTGLYAWGKALDTEQPRLIMNPYGKDGVAASSSAFSKKCVAVAGYSYNNNTVEQSARVVLHEIGHTFGAKHEENDGNCIMDYGKISDLSFCDNSKEQIKSYINS